MTAPMGSLRTRTNFHTLLLRPEIVTVAVTAAKFELCALSCGWIISPPGEQGPTVAPHGWETAHTLVSGAVALGAVVAILG